MKKIIALAWLVLVIPAFASTNSAPHVYGTSFKDALKIGNDLYETLNEKYQKNVNPQLIQIETSDAPVITPIEGGDDNKVLHEVSVSVGFLDLINHIAHAKAIDRIQPGFFQQYVLNLARQPAGDAPVEAPNMVNARYWQDDVMNDQISYFNQMVGMTVAISLSHHYLGHYSKYASQMLAGKLTPINNFIAPPEWEISVRLAALNSLDCALGTDGAKALFEAIDKMPSRPPWTAFIIPANTDIKKLNKQLAKYETDYFHGGLK
jgi:hypothetical protein